jgi:hypothetical protein
VPPIPELVPGKLNAKLSVIMAGVPTAVTKMAGGPTAVEKWLADLPLLQK